MKSRASVKRKEDIAAGPSSSGKLAYDRVETYLVTTKEGGDDTVDAKLSLYARAIRNQKGLWFKIVQDLDDIAQIDFFDLSIGQAGENSGETSNENSGPVVSVVVKHLNAPIFIVSWQNRVGGASTFGEVQKMLLLDFRTLAPRIVAALECVSAEGGGVCGVLDNGSALTTTLACNWDAAKADFLCTSTATGDYTAPFTRRFHLASRLDAPYVAEKGDPLNLSARRIFMSRDNTTSFI